MWVARKSNFVFSKLLVSLSIFISTGPVLAQSGFIDGNSDSALVVTLSSFEGSFITLNEALDLAMKNATAVREAEAGVRVARGALRREKGAFDPELFAEVQTQKSDQPSGSPFAGALVLESEELTGALGLRLKLPIGTELEASLNTTRLESNSGFALLNPQYNNFGKLEFTQPLLSGFGPSAHSGVSSARRQYEAAQARYRDAVLSLTAEIEKVYWDLYAAERDLAVQILIRDQSEIFLKETEIKQAVGQVGPNQVANARVFLAEQEQTVLDREESLDRISNQLGTLLGERLQNWKRYRPSDQPQSDFVIDSLDHLIELALGANQDLKAAEENWAAARALATGAAWNSLPKLDLFGSLGASGLSGTDTLGGAFNGNAGQAWDQVFNRDYPNWNLGIRLSIPIGLRPGLGERERLRGEADRAYQQYIATKRKLEEAVRSAHQELLHASRRLTAARTGVVASSEQVRIGRLEYQAGRTTAFELVRLRADLAAAQQRYSQALVRASKASAELKRLTSENIANATN